MSGENYSWAQPLDESLIPDGFTLVDSLDPEHPVPSCRNCDIPWIPDTTFVVTADGFLVSDNVEICSCEVLDEGFRHSDHNPVRLRFVLKP